MKALITFNGLLLLACAAHGQDAPLAQPQRMEPLLSPGAAGMGDGFRASALHRARRAEGNVPFSTSALVADGAIVKKGSRSDMGHQGFGWGGVVFDDRAGSPRMRSTDVAVVLGYHVRFGACSQLGGGVQLGLKQFWSDLIDGQWASQYDGLSYDPSRPSGERFTERPITAGDAALGLCYRYSQKGNGREGRSGIDLRAGIAGHHLNKPRLSLDRENGHRLARRWSAYATGSFADARGKRRLEPLVLVSLQGREFMAQGGTVFALALVEQNSFTGPDRVLSAGLGAYARSDGSAIASLHARWGEFGAVASYELALSAARRNALGNGAAEVSVFCELGQGKR